MTSTEKLVHALEEANDPRLAPILERARQNHYHDFKSELATPIYQLVADLRAVDREGFADLIHRAIGGEFDATKAESDEWAASPEGQALFRELRGQ